MKNPNNRKPANQLINKKIVFILGIPRSGTTWLLSIFENHPKFLKLTPKMLNISVSSPTKETGLLVRGYDDNTIAHKILSIQDDRTFVEKTPSHLFELPRIKKLFPDSKIIFIYRDAIDIIYSMLQTNKFWKDSPKTFQEALNLFLKFYKTQKQYESLFDYKIYYEKLWKQPVKEMNSLFRKLGVEGNFTPDIIEKTRFGRNLGNNLKTVFRNGNPGQGQINFTPNQIDTILNTKNKIDYEINYPGKYLNTNSSNTSKPLKILIALNILQEFTGSETYTVLLAETLIKFGHQVEIYAHRGYGPPLISQDNFIKIWSKNDFYLNENKYDIIITQHIEPTKYVLSKYSNTPAISINHGIIEEENPQKYPNLLQYVTVSDEVAKRAIDEFTIPNEQVSIIPNFIDLTEFHFNNNISAKNKMLWAGTIYNWKIESLKAAIKLTAQIPDLVLDVVGQNILNVDFSQYNHVRYLGCQKIDSSFLSQYKLVFGVGRVALEALASGIPIYIAGKDGSDGILDETNFYKFRQCNFSGRYNPTSYKEINYEREAGKIIKLLSNENEQIKLKKQYHKLREEIDTNIIVGKLEKILYSVKNAKPENTLNPISNFKLQKETDISIIIPVYNKIEFTKKCIQAINRNTNKIIRFEFLIIDNGSTDGTAEYLEELIKKIPYIKVIFNKQNLGFSKACNIGAQNSNGKYLLFLNNDTEPQSNWINPLIHVLDQDSNVGAVGSKLLFPDGSIQHAGIAIVDDRKIKEPIVGRHIYYRHRSDYPAANRLKSYQALTAASLLIRKQAFEEVGGFDENFWNGYEDVDLCFKLAEKGWKLVYQPESIIIHYESQSGPERFSKVRKNIELLHKKWKGKISPDFLIEANGKLIQTSTNKIKEYKTASKKNLTFKHKGELKQIKFTVSIIILTFNQLRYTKECLESVKKYTKDVKYEIIIVDNASTDGTINYLKKWHKRHANSKLILNSENKGFAAGNNQGIHEASGRYILILNNDVVVTPGWLTKMVNALKTYPQIGIVGPVTNYISGPQMIENVQYKTHEGLIKYANTRSDKYKNKITISQRLVGFCMLLKRVVIDKAGMFDERFEKGNYEDDDLCLRASLLGFKMGIAEDSFVHHYGNKSFEGNKLDYESSILENLKVFINKWKYFGQPHPIWLRILYDSSQYNMKNGKIEDALWSIDKAYRLNPNLPDIHKQYLNILSKTERYQEYQALLKAYLNKYPQDSEYLNKFGLLKWQQQSYSDAIQLFEQAVSNNGQHPEHLKNLADAYLHQEKFEDAIKLLQLLMQKFPEDFESYEKMANLYIENGDWDSAKDLLDKYLDGCAENTYATDMRKLMEIPEVFLAYQLINQGGLDEAEQLLQNYLKEYPKCEFALSGLGSIQFNKSDFQTAEKIYTNLLNNSPQNEEALYYLSRIYLLENELDKFINLYNENAETFSKLQTLRKVYIEYLIKSGHIQEASEKLDSYLQEFTDDVESHIWAGNLLYQEGDRRAAVSHFRKVLEIDSTNEIAKANLDFLEAT